MKFIDLVNIILVDIDSDDYETKTKIKKFLNRAYKELVKKDKIYKQISLISDDNGYISKPSDFYKISCVLFDDKEIPYEEDKDKIRIPFKNRGVILEYAYIPNDLSDNDELQTNELNNEWLIAYTKYLYYQSEEEFDKAEVFRRDYESFPITKKRPVKFKIKWW